uniref:ribosomal protein L24 n=1 Tax=Sargassum siliquastrum TaxID=127572 RepID=UPI00207A17D6|nr:ribosomal protein L24 [Sargassum siliquastrum]YP_010485422.1 50S ribosomal protein L24 [Sargassum macrocarpum]YP_010485561.1 50S ribosomal protein L24 [Sargassum serratifolium]URP30999.1 ribosomal protein L24 [Sargassum siliquastrum]UVW81355.1 50S ribosomal protein L24 [Sargassum macrocarpum]UVW81494.1 50S ribosomal protein L24 [Sargassum serratifolium]
MKKTKLKRKLRIKIGETVKVISGQEKGKVGLVKKIVRSKNKLIIQGINIRTKHIKSNRPGEDGEIKRIEFPIDSSNVSSYKE